MNSQYAKSLNPAHKLRIGPLISVHTKGQISNNFLNLSTYSKLPIQTQPLHPILMLALSL